MDKSSTAVQTDQNVPPTSPRTPARWVVMAFVLLLALALIVIATSVWMLHLV
jgi:hypothetical protein